MCLRSYDKRLNDKDRRDRMVRDRLAEMQSKGAEGDSPSKSKKKEKNGTPLLSSEENLEECLAKITELDEKVKKMRKDIDEMAKIQKNIITSPLTDKAEVKKLEQVSDKIFNSSTQLQKEINSYRSEVSMLHMENAHEKMINLQLTRLSGDVTKNVNDLRASQMEYIEKTQKLHNRKYEIVTGKEAGANGEPVDSSQIQFAGDFLMEAQKARQELRDLETRDVEIKKLEGSVFEVNQLFKEINALVMEQGEVITRIEDHVNEAVVEVDNAGVQLKQANEYQVKARKKKMCIIGVCLAIVIIAVMIVVIVITSNN